MWRHACPLLPITACPLLLQAIGYDMDYTLIHYDVEAWEGKAYVYGLQVRCACCCACCACWMLDQAGHVGTCVLHSPCWRPAGVGLQWRECALGGHLPFRDNGLTMSTARPHNHALQSLREMGCPVEGLRFDRSLVIRGLIMDTELGNLVKADRFGWVCLHVELSVCIWLVLLWPHHRYGGAQPGKADRFGWVAGLCLQPGTCL